ncbi:uncharacterized protein LOC121887482 isoform X2 [Thunnus maccoyii]|uniref:uncharacterized protein LOC121887482 isoform X2 n=1 Tax=Thunnus maccoyii TaxID=8240 RepID=UPI001C4C17A3|nr:uncharacterized protein LOC121887482 isoform X2 [Thunnus maccoyii]
MKKKMEVTSQQAVTFKNTSTQTDTPSRTTVGKWLSTGTLKEHVRSKGTQAVSSLSVGIETTFGSPDFTLSSTPIQGPGFRPRKRPHLEFEEEWQSQPLIGSTPIGNLQMSAATYFSGAFFFQLEKVLGLPFTAYENYNQWTFSTKSILDLQLFQSNEVGRSYHMEKEGLKRSLDLLESNGLSLEYIVIVINRYRSF